MPERCPFPAMPIIDRPGESTTDVHKTHARINDDLKIKSVESLAGEIYGPVCSSLIVNGKKNAVTSPNAARETSALRESLCDCGPPFDVVLRRKSCK